MTHALAHTYEVAKREMIIDTDDVRVHTMRLSPGQSVPWHKHSIVDDTFLCMSGSMTVRTDDDIEKVVLSPGERYTVVAGVGHYVEPSSIDGTKFLLIQAVGKHDFIPIDAPT